MTAEIAILNTGAVALAADSAVTVTLGDDDTKVYSSQNKILALTRGGRVGALVYGSADFMSVPIETLLKEFRHRHGHIEYPHLKDYVRALVAFLRDEVVLYTTSQQRDRFVLDMALHMFVDIRTTIQARIEFLEEELTEAGDNNVEQTLEARTPSIVEMTIGEYSERANRAEPVGDATKEVADAARRLLRPRLREMREAILGQEISGRYARRLNRIAYKASVCMLGEIALTSTGNYTGIVLAGFGTEEIFPSYKEVRIEGLFEGMLKHADGAETVVSPENRATIGAFAQRDMVQMFMEGISLEYLRVLHVAATLGIQTYTSDLLKGLDRYSEQERKELAVRLAPEQQSFAQSFMERVLHFGTSHFAAEIIDVVAVLPKEQLAELAEALISLTSLRRRVTYEKETVGGPTDVAIITKGDGLIWIKRKHYFEENLNPAYFARTYRRMEES